MVSLILGLLSQWLINDFFRYVLLTTKSVKLQEIATNLCSLNFRLLFGGYFNTAVTSEQRGFTRPLFTNSRGDHASGHDVTAFRHRSLLTHRLYLFQTKRSLAKIPCLSC